VSLCLAGISAQTRRVTHIKVRSTLNNSEAYAKQSG